MQCCVCMHLFKWFLWNSQAPLLLSSNHSCDVELGLSSLSKKSESWSCSCFVRFKITQQEILSSCILDDISSPSLGSSVVASSASWRMTRLSCGCDGYCFCPRRPRHPLRSPWASKLDESFLKSKKTGCPTKLLLNGMSEGCHVSGAPSAIKALSAATATLEINS